MSRGENRSALVVAFTAIAGSGACGAAPRGAPDTGASVSGTPDPAEVFTSGWADPAATPDHVLEAGPGTVAWGYYWSEAPPVLRIESGDVVEFTTMITNRPDRLEASGVPPDQVENALRTIYDSVADRGPGGHILTGPVFVEGAEPGDVLEVRVLSVDLPLSYGYNGCSGFLPDACPETRTRILTLDRERMVSEFAPGIEVPLAPFFGSMGVAPPREAGRWSSVPPWIHAGNIDNREMVAGTRLLIPVHVPGALFEIGDGHAAQGDGEVDQTAIETSLRGRIQLVVRTDMTLEWPRAETPTHWIAMASDEDLVVATRLALEQGIRLVADVLDLEPGEAYRLISLAGDLRITQLVDQKVGVHVMIPKALRAGGI
jgi:acetamidase/formamidase